MAAIFKHTRFCWALYILKSGSARATSIAKLYPSLPQSISSPTRSPLSYYSTKQEPSPSLPATTPFPPACAPKSTVIVGPLMCTSYDSGPFLVNLVGNGYAFESGKALVDFYIQLLAKVLGSEEEAKERIYFISPAWNILSFGARIDKDTCSKLRGLPEVRNVIQDLYSEVREKSIGELPPPIWRPTNSSSSSSSYPVHKVPA